MHRDELAIYSGSGGRVRGRQCQRQGSLALYDLFYSGADPLFVDPAQGDFALRPDSAAAQISFEPWDLSAVGPRPPSASPKSKGCYFGRRALAVGDERFARGFAGLLLLA